MQNEREAQSVFQAKNSTWLWVKLSVGFVVLVIASVIIATRHDRSAQKEIAISPYPLPRKSAVNEDDKLKTELERTQLQIELAKLRKLKSEAEERERQLRENQRETEEKRQEEAKPIILSADGQREAEILLTEQWSREIRFKYGYYDTWGRLWHVEPDAGDRIYRSPEGEEVTERAGEDVILPSSFHDSFRVRLTEKPKVQTKFRVLVLPASYQLRFMTGKDKVTIPIFPDRLSPEFEVPEQCEWAVEVEPGEGIIMEFTHAMNATYTSSDKKIVYRKDVEKVSYTSALYAFTLRAFSGRQTATVTILPKKQ